jgi:uncharacterized protein (UPF0332 family)
MMQKPLSNDKLLHVSKSKKSFFENSRFVVELVSASGLTLDQLIEIACADRLKLAQENMKSAKTVMNFSKPQYRLTVACAYYAMYHAARALVFYVCEGDDHEEHSKLPANLPMDLPSCADWRNKLKSARFERNKADYDPYPKSDRAFSKSASNTLKDAEEFILVAKSYLRTKGCTL